MSTHDVPNGVQSDSGRASSRTLIFVVASVALAIGCVVLALQFFVAERLPTLDEPALEAAMSRWSEHGPSDYDMDIELSGAQPGRIHVEVRNREVTAETRDGRDPGRSTWETWSVPGMFDTLERDLQIAADPQAEIQATPGTSWRLRCEFDRRYSYPARYHRMVTGGPEVYWVVTQFQSK